MSFGSTLKLAREAQGLSTQELSLKTKIRGDYLRALEEGNTALLPERTFARSYLQRYARELGVDPAPLLTDFDRLLPASPEIAQSLQSQTVRNQVGRRGLALGPAALAGLASAAVVLGAAGYYLFNRPSAAPVPTAVVTPQEIPATTRALARTVRLTVSSVPPGARVFLDNRDLGKTPVKSFPVDARQNAVLRVEYSGRQTIDQTISLQTGRNLRARLLPTSQGKSSLADLNAPQQATPKPAAGTPAQSSASRNEQALKPATPAATPTAAVRVTFSAPSWTRITDKTGRLLFEGTPAAGTTKAFPAGVVIRTGNAGAVSVSVNGGAALAMGGSGRVVTRSF
ncbi:helix-turn-helix domain-containing protein [Deinococcus sp. QL22]|uniref:helix-turn-helix domain-containing protein n=1 Tax=Deinococcus sp. QL22 TaxID=2939437 RepID=UPI002017EDAC|nr:helix-turn-helix domain-containing protein [Deinococcus sp. QL22]UQN06348.1 DUF4115 domain-containing protein [Deinococcus sp. QL22]